MVFRMCAICCEFFFDIYIYIYIERERERERKRVTELFSSERFNVSSK